MKSTHITPFYHLKSLFLVDIGEETSSLGVPYSYPRQRFHYIIHFVYKGEGTFQRQSPKSNNSSIIKAGDIFAIYKDDAVVYHSKSDTPFHYFWIGFDGSEAKYIMDYLGLSPSIPVLKTKNHDAVLEAFQNLLSLSKEGAKYDLFIAFLQLVNILKENIETRNNDPVITSSQTLSIFKKAENFIKNNLNQNIKVQDLISHLNIDRSYFSKIFKKHYGYTPQTYIRNAKLKKAEYLLKNTDYPISEIAQLLAFTDIYCFSKLFKKQYGISPLQYRNNKNTKSE